MRANRLLLVALALIPRAAAAQGNPVGPEFHVNTFFTSDQTRPSVATDSSGNFVVVWTSDIQDGSDRGIFGQRYASSGAPLGSEFRVNTYTTSHQLLPALAAHASGNLVVVWTSQQDGSSLGVFGQRYASSGAPVGPEFRVNTYTTGAQAGSAVATDTAGNFVVVWFGPDGSDAGIFGQRYASSGTPLGPEFRVNTGVTNYQDYPSVAADASGNFVVVWTSHPQYGPALGIFGQRYASSGTPLGPEFLVNAYTGVFLGKPSVDEDASGNFVVVWSAVGPGDSDYGVFGQRYAGSGAPLGSEFRVNTYTTGNQIFPTVTSDALGNFVVVWNSAIQDGSGDGVFGQRYSSSGAPLGPEFRANTFTTNRQRFPSVAANASGDFVVVWDSFFQEGATYGIFGQRYAQIVPVELTDFRIE